MHGGTVKLLEVVTILPYILFSVVFGTYCKETLVYNPPTYNRHTLANVFRKSYRVCIICT